MDTGAILYEVSYQFDFFLLIPIVIMIGGCVFPKAISKSYEQQGKEININFVKIISLVFSIIAGIFVTITILSEIISYNQVVVA